MNKTIPKPALNISAFYLPEPYASLGDSWYGHDWADPRTNTKPFSDPENTALYVEGTNSTYSMQYVEQKGSCQPRSTYQWGFSFLQVFSTSILLLIWSCGTYIMWLSSHKTLARHVDNEVPTKYRAAVTLVSALNLDLSRIGNKPDTLTNQQLTHIMKTNLSEGRILTENSNISVPGYSVRRDIWERLKDHPFWFIMLSLSTAFLSTWVAFPNEWSIGLGHPFVLPFHTGLVFALGIGRTRKSRFSFVMMGLLISIIVAASVLVSLSRNNWDVIV